MISLWVRVAAASNYCYYYIFQKLEYEFLDFLCSIYKPSEKQLAALSRDWRLSLDFLIILRNS